MGTLFQKTNKKKESKNLPKMYLQNQKFCPTFAEPLYKLSAELSFHLIFT